MEMRVKVKPFTETLNEFLKDPETAALYLKEALEYSGPKREEVLLKSIYQVVKAQKIRLGKRKKA